jgi:S-adenosylmethionine decarboxylase proenzyme
MSHLILDIEDIENDALIHSVDGLRSLMDQICKDNHYTVLHKYHYQFLPYGITIVYVLSESHFSIHTYPENKFIAIDLYTCRTAQEEIYKTIEKSLEKELHGRIKKSIIINRS